MGKSIRQNKIIEIISSQEIETQEELVDILNASNFNVTQATVSRDIKELGLIKVQGREKKYMYAYERKSSDVHDVKHLHLFRNCVIEVLIAMNIVVVKTLGGNGNSAGVMIDKLRLKEIVGSVAGDDTVLIVTKSEQDAESVKVRLQEILL